MTLSGMRRMKLITENLSDELIAAMEAASGIYIMTSFIMNSGVRLLSSHLHKALDNGADVKILTGDYLYITQPEGLQMLYEMDARLEARLWRSKGSSFHPKAYLFEYENNEGLLIVGSSNLSFTALKAGVEWNLSLNDQAHSHTFQMALDAFMENFYHPTTLPLNPNTIQLYQQDYHLYHQKNPGLLPFIDKLDQDPRPVSEAQKRDGLPTEAGSQTESESTVVTPLHPRPAQEIALEALERTLEEEYDKAMVVMATGLGKTYLAGFFAQRFRRVLFIAHREEILFQARKSFRRIMPDRTYGIYNGQHKEGEAECVFASINTLGMKKHRESFDTNHFDLIVVDEFHHAAERTYRSILEYFKPRFLLGITATPDRMDGKDVYALCDGNVAYQMHFIEAIRREWLAPFQYHGVYDETDYSQIRWLGNRYDEEELLTAQLKESQAENIYNAWHKHKQTRTLGFCSSIRQADFLADYFRKKGVPALSLHSRTTEMSREEAIRQITEGSLAVIFTVDLFNEGVDIPSVDTLLFVRPTESLTVFTQQVGRGLRLYDGKEYCSIIDLIGNYRNADVKLRLFSMEEEGSDKRKRVDWEPIVPGNCVLDLDTRVVDLLEEWHRKRLPRRDRLLRSFEELRGELGRIPSYLELHLYGDANSREYQSEFGSYVGFLYWADLLNEREKETYRRYESWLVDVEKTAMSKSYKMIVHLYMLERGEDRWTEPATPNEVARFFYDYLMAKEYRKRHDFSDQGSRRLWEYDEDKVARLIATMPMTMWSGARGSRTTFEDGKFALDFDVAPEDEALLHRWTREACLYRFHLHFERREGKRHD